jgi:hypothetical protein
MMVIHSSENVGSIRNTLRYVQEDANIPVLDYQQLNCVFA